MRAASPSYSSATTRARSWTRVAIAPGNRWIAGLVANASARSIAASFRGSSVPARSFSTYGPANAFCTVTCWSIAKPTSSANGSCARSSQAFGSSVNQSAAGTRRILRRRFVLFGGRLADHGFERVPKPVAEVRLELLQPADLGARMTRVDAGLTTDLLRPLARRLQRRLGVLARRLAQLVRRSLRRLVQRFDEI